MISFERQNTTGSDGFMTVFGVVQYGCPFVREASEFYEWCKSMPAKIARDFCHKPVLYVCAFRMENYRVKIADT